GAGAAPDRSRRRVYAAGWSRCRSAGGASLHNAPHCFQLCRMRGAAQFEVVRSASTLYNWSLMTAVPPPRGRTGIGRPVTSHTTSGGVPDMRRLFLILTLAAASSAAASPYVITPGDPCKVEFESHAAMESFTGKTQK